ncbi:MAG: DNA polymerase I [Chloroflexota bacterium]|nr:DNA polymerase I [Chloroflexota bacterium]
MAGEQVKRLVLIDGYGLIFRAYHALPVTIATSKGEITNATYGFTAMLLEVIRRETPDYVVMTFDRGRTFRHDEFVAYKANRSEMPEDLRGQLVRIREVVETLGIDIYEQEGFEADDVIGTLARQAAQHGLDSLIVTGDNDLLQLVDDKTRAVLPGAGPRARFQDTRYFDVEAVQQRFGFKPEFVPDYKAIIGDKSDNIPNIPGLGEKTATNLITQFGHIENLFDHIEEVKPPKTQAALKNYREQCFQSKHLTTIVTTVPVELDLEKAKAHQIDRARIVELFRELEFNSLVGKIDQLPGSPPPSPPPTPKVAKPNKFGQLSMFDQREATTETTTNEEVKSLPNGVKYTALRSLEEVKKLVARLYETGRFAFDTETNSLSQVGATLVGLSISPAPEESYYLPFRHSPNGILEPGQLEWAAVAELLRPPFADEKLEKIAHHAKFDLAILYRHGLNIARINFDVMLAAQMLGINKVGLKDLAFNRLGQEMTHIETLIGSGKQQITMEQVSLDKVMPYACADADLTLRLADNLRPDLEETGLWNLFSEVELPLIPVLCMMELSGVAVAVERLGEISRYLTRELAALEEEIYKIAGGEFNINSPDQLGTVLFGKLGMQSGKKTSTKKYSTSKEVLEALREQHPVVGQVLEYRQLGKLKSTYVDSLPLLVNPNTGRIHTSFHQIGSSTGRISSNDPNLQNIPIRSDIGREVRKAFVADNASAHHLFEEKSLLLAADYSQIELRLLAHLTDDPRLLDAFHHDRDIHAATAADVFGVALEQVTPNMRRMAKTINFGIIYGLSAHGLATRTEMGYKEAAEFIKHYNERYPNIKTYLDKTPDEARQKGYVQTLFGRRRYMADLKISNSVLRQEAERQAINMPVQGTAADIVKMAMNKIYQELQAKKFKSKLLLQVHDELVFELPESELSALAEMVRRLMENVVTLNVPLKADLKVGQNWGEMTPL